MTTIDTVPAPAATRGRAVNTAVWGVQILLAALFAFAGLIKLAGVQAEVDAFAVIGLGQWFRYLVGALEVLGAIGLLVPRWSGPAALGLTGVMAGAIVTHLTVLPPAAFAVIPAVFAVVLGLIARFRWPQATALTGRR
jgi:putative oxidoreductase